MRHLVAREFHVDHSADALYDCSFLAHRRFPVVQFKFAKLIRAHGARYASNAFTHNRVFDTDGFYPYQKYGS
jgi:hypothetical protein